MINSIYINNILSLLVDGHPEEGNLRNQIELLIDKEYTYTGAGLIVSFDYSFNIREYQVCFAGILNGVKIMAPELELGAQSNLFFQEGIILYLELVSNSGFYPGYELSKYKLSQEWLSIGGKEIIVN